MEDVLPCTTLRDLKKLSKCLSAQASYPGSFEYLDSGLLSEIRLLYVGNLQGGEVFLLVYSDSRWKVVKKVFTVQKHGRNESEFGNPSISVQRRENYRTITIEFSEDSESSIPEGEEVTYVTRTLRRLMICSFDERLTRFICPVDTILKCKISEKKIIEDRPSKRVVVATSQSRFDIVGSSVTISPTESTTGPQCAHQIGTFDLW